ncbi:MAG TPA: DUF4845 domain-containing protein [Bryobacteraceae bacterium]|nr:DUF4845 domain-containing protein [Bryobacteraceae bacterium]
MTPPRRLLRVAAGILVLLALVGVALVLLPPYASNWRFQRYLNQLADDPATASAPPDEVQAKITREAQSLGLPLAAHDVQITRSQNAIRIDALYVVHVDIIGYTVDLHFRPAVGGS